MKRVSSIRAGEPIALPRFGALRADTPLTSSDLYNVIPFERARAGMRHVPDVAVPADAPPFQGAPSARDRPRLLAFAVLSVALHGGLLAAALREPMPLASIGLPVMSIEIVVGATAPAGVAQAPGENDVQAAAADKQVAEPRDAEQRATEQPQDIAVAREEKAPEQSAQPETAHAEPVPAVAMVESPKAEEATATPTEIPPDTTEISLLPQPEEKPPAPKNEHKPEAKPQSPAPVQNAAPAKERRRIDAPTKDRAVKQAKASAPSTAANNVGVGRSDSDSNYAGLVSAHLRRHQQYPSDARSRGEQGTATVSFGLDGGGRVTSARLVRGSGVGSIDQEVQAMVRRASPFPAPPSGRAVNFTVPVTFRLN